MASGIEYSGGVDVERASAPLVDMVDEVPLHNAARFANVLFVANRIVFGGLKFGYISFCSAPALSIFQFLTLLFRRPYLYVSNRDQPWKVALDRDYVTWR